jgi:hypothetical protein
MGPKNLARGNNTFSAYVKSGDKERSFSTSKIIELIVISLMKLSQRCKVKPKPTHTLLQFTISCKAQTFGT